MKTRIVEVRDIRPDENGIESLEGFQPCDPNAHYIMRGIKGEEYPIEKTIFHDTYIYVDDGDNTFDDELCTCGHSKGYHAAHELDKHGGKCEKCDCKIYTWGKFVKYTGVLK